MDFSAGRSPLLKYKKIKIGKSFIEAISIKLQRKTFLLLRGRRGYVMCGYLNLRAAEKIKDVAAKITGVSTIQEALTATVHSASSPARKLGIYKGQPVREVLKIIA